MRAVRCTAYGTPEVLTLEVLADPVPGPGDVVVDVAVAAVNFPDVLFVANRYQISVPPPFTPGSEFAGTVSAVGTDVADVRLGDVVRGTAMTGAFAEKVLVPSTAVRPVPPGLDLAVAAASGVTFSTAWSALRSVAAVAPGEWVAVTGAAGGVGSAAVVLAGELGARVLAIVSTPAKAAFCADLGADAVLDLSTSPDAKAHVREITCGVDVVLDVVGGDLAEVLLRTMRPGGRFVTVGFASGTIPRIPLNLVLLKDVAVLGFDVRTFPTHHPEQATRDAAELTGLFRRGLGAIVTDRYPLERAVEALTDVAARGTTGKVVIDVGRQV
jgi:NADPH:quinone reductase